MTKHTLTLLTTLCAAALTACSPAPAAAPPRAAASLPPQPAAAPTTKGDTTMATMQTATLGGGCFWCIEAVLDRLRGVDKVVSGYSGGHVANPTYEDVSSGTTGHAEVVQVTFDPQVISYHDLLEIFFAMHDPTTLNRQGADAGTQYRSVIFYRSPEQKKVAEDVIADLTRQKTFDKPIVTQVVPFEQFYPAEEYHQQYYERNASQGYCRVVISPKVAKLREKYLSRLKQ